ncbi:substrate-binding domain-containing protein [Variovorax sp. Sphag1AA]|uniref:substrate-binding domain-containing protein n=1 Tax=Variovorax sp. Sphag1AA TaxID=2587027 RepID=UPI00160AE205|nr:substrate-binding domain-containing protein [Variovorax sp. Sphag1AA]MBB3178612.1 molybdate transport system substrate-binding protein [Variovorax sp. Sphag1AA]
MTTPLRGISSMATRQVLAELVQGWTTRGGEAVAIESVGGVDAARRVQGGEEPFDVVFLASDAIDKLLAAGRVVPGSKVDLVHSGVAVAVRTGTPHPDLTSEASVRQAILAAPTIGYSTGPSGVALQKLFERWGVADQVRERTVQAPPGVPVGSLVAQGQVALGFQQLSELISLQGIDVVGPLPAEIQITTTFSGGVVAGSPNADAVQRLLTFMASPEAAEAKRRQGMDPA